MSVVVLQSTELLGMKVKILNYLEFMLIKHDESLFSMNCFAGSVLLFFTV